MHVGAIGFGLFVGAVACSSIFTYPWRCDWRDNLFNVMGGLGIGFMFASIIMKIWEVMP